MTDEPAKYTDNIQPPRLRLTIEPTDEMTNAHGKPVRVWKGQTDDGIPVLCYIAFVAVPEDRPAEEHARFERALRAVQVQRELVSFDLRMVAD